jgi:hypothetical protein
LDYPWYGVVDDTTVEQGDVFDDCPILRVPSDFSPSEPGLVRTTWDARDVIVLSQSCDLVIGREKVSDVLVCSASYRSELPEVAKTNDKMEKLRKSALPRYHLLNTCDLEGHAREFRVVDFATATSLPLAYLRHRTKLGARLRLLHPYREHLSQAFARFFMRVGLPSDIKAFGK